MRYRLQFLERVQEKIHLGEELTGRSFTRDEMAQVILRHFMNVTTVEQAHEILNQLYGDYAGPGDGKAD